MFRVDAIPGGQWKVVEDGDKVVFVGTKNDAEVWLDLQENLQPRPHRAGAWLTRLVRTLVGHVRPVVAKGTMADQRITVTEIRRQA